MKPTIDLIDQLIKNLYDEIANLKNKLWEGQRKDVEDIQFWKDRYKASQEKRLEDGVAIYNLKEKIRKLEDSDYEPRYTPGYFDERAETPPQPGTIPYTGSGCTI